MKRNLFAELKEGFAELEAERHGKLTLRDQPARWACLLYTSDAADE